MAIARRILLILLTFVVVELRAASSAETREFRVAQEFFGVHSWQRAENEFAQFIGKYPQSEYRAEAILLQAESRFYQTNYDAAISLLEANLGNAAGLADEYRFWIAESHFQKGDYANAIAAYGRLLSMHAGSKRRLESLVNEAAARSKLGQWEELLTTLGRSDGEFFYAVVTMPTNEVVTRGLLLLGEAHLARGNFIKVEVMLNTVTNANLDPLLSWQAERLRGEARRLNRQLPEALASSSNLVSTAGRIVTGRAPLLAESFALQARILEELGRNEEAVAAWRQNLGTNTPTERQREALLASSRLNLALRNDVAAEQTLQRFLADNPNSPAADAAILTLGELELKRSSQAGTNALSGETNRLNALGWFTRLINNYSNSPLAGKAELNRGWCYWLARDSTNSVDAFRRAVDRLTGEDLAIARYKLGDSFFEQGNFAWARENYYASVKLAAGLPRLKNELVPAGWRQILSSDIKLNNEAGATEAMSQILLLPLGDGAVEGAMMERGQSHLDAGKPERALEDFQKFVGLFPGATNRPQAELLIARTREQLGDWGGAITNYVQWAERYPEHPLRAEAEFQQALALLRAGDETNALSRMSNFVAVFGTNEMAPRAMWWLGDYHFNQGEYPEAEKNYKLLYLDRPDSDLADEAVMMAGRAAMAGSRYSDAIEHFSVLTQKTNSPLWMWAQAVFAYGDALMLKANTETNKMPSYTLALQTIGQIPERRAFQTNEIAALAWGEMAKCYRQMGSAGWTNAETAYRKIIEFPAAKVAARSEAQVGLGLLHEEMAKETSGEDQSALLKGAVGNYLDVVLGGNLRDGETRDLFWSKKAGLEAVRLLDATQDWERLLKLCERMQELLPVASARWQRHIEVAKKHLDKKN